MVGKVDKNEQHGGVLSVGQGKKCERDGGVLSGRQGRKNVCEVGGDER